MLWMRTFQPGAECADHTANSTHNDHDWGAGDYHCPHLTSTGRDQVKQLWLAHYYDNGKTASLMANSIWLDTQTGGLLSDHTQGIKLDPATVSCLASTAYFSADWDKTFSEMATNKEVFHCEGYDIRTDFMHKTFIDYYYYVDPTFAAISLSLSGSHRMWLILIEAGQLLSTDQRTFRLDRSRKI